MEGFAVGLELDLVAIDEGIADDVEFRVEGFVGGEDEVAAGDIETAEGETDAGVDEGDLAFEDGACAGAAETELADRAAIEGIAEETDGIAR